MESEREVAEALEQLVGLVERARAVLVELGERATRRVEELSQWTVEQQLYHAALSGDLACANVLALLEGTSARIVQAGEANELARELFARRGYPRGQSRAPRTVWPPEVPERALLEQELERLRQALEQLRPRGEAIARTSGRIPHRELGALSAREWVDFARLHTAHHLAIVEDLARVLVAQD